MGNELAALLEKFALDAARAAKAMREVPQGKDVPDVEIQHDDDDDDGDRHPGVVDLGQARQARRGDGPPKGTMLQVPAGELWSLVNASRYMIRMAREGKVPSQDQRAPLCRYIKALKTRGLVKKPCDLSA